MIRITVREVAESLGFNITALARQAGLSRPSVMSLWRNSTDRFDRHTLDKLCTTLGCEVGDLIQFVPGHNETG